MKWLHPLFAPGRKTVSDDAFYQWEATRHAVVACMRTWTVGAWWKAPIGNLAQTLPTPRLVHW